MLNAAIILAVVVIAIAIWAKIMNRREDARRAKLSPGELRRLEHEEAVWSRRYGF